MPVRVEGGKVVLACDPEGPVRHSEKMDSGCGRPWRGHSHHIDQEEEGTGSRQGDVLLRACP